jgi:hypothetical protein
MEIQAESWRATARAQPSNPPLPRDNARDPAQRMPLGEADGVRDLRVAFLLTLLRALSAWTA